MTEPSAGGRPRIVFAGTPGFSVPPLRALIEHGFSPVAVYTQPDRPAGRGRKMSASPVKEVALEYGIDVIQPETLRDPAARAQLAALRPDLMIVVAYGLILPLEILKLPRLGCINIHASLLPRWRGAAPIHRAILAGDTESGITIMQMDEGLDTGPMLLSRPCAIAAGDTSGDLHDRLADLGASCLLEALPGVLDGSLEARDQDESAACYANKLQKSEAEIVWSHSAEVLARQVRAFNPWPVAQTIFAGQVLRIWAAEALPAKISDAPGTVVRVGRDSMDVVTGNGLLRLLRVQMPGKKQMPVSEFLHAHSVEGVVLGKKGA